MPRWMRGVALSGRVVDSRAMSSQPKIIPVSVCPHYYGTIAPTRREAMQLNLTFDSQGVAGPTLGIPLHRDMTSITLVAYIPFRAGRDRPQSSDPTGPSSASDAPDDKSEDDLIGGPFVVTESDPNSFTPLVRTPVV